MTASILEQRFLQAIQLSYQKVIEYGVRSSEKTKVLHGWFQDELKRELGDEFVFTGQTPDSVKKDEPMSPGCITGKTSMYLSPGMDKNSALLA